MLIKLLLELLFLLGGEVPRIEDAIAEAHSADTTGTKVSKIAATAASIVSAASTVIDDATK